MLRAILSILIALNYILCPFPSTQPILEDRVVIARKIPDEETAVLVNYIEKVNPALSRLEVQEVATALLSVEKRLELPQYILAALAKVESNFDHSVIGRQGENGILQLHPKWFPVLENVEDHVLRAAQYFQSFLRKYEGNTNLAIASYNQGESAIPNPGSSYVQRVLRAWTTIREEMLGWTIFGLSVLPLYS